MCTLSWLPSRDGYALCFNRDERRTRAAASPPTILRRDGVRFIAPLDGEAGGTWVLVNEFGVSLGLLNRYQQTNVTRPGQTSRGLLLLELAACQRGLDVQKALEERNLAWYAPFTIAAIAPGAPARLAVWDGRQLTCGSHASPGLILTSSAVDEGRVRASREATFQQEAPRDSAALVSIHRSHHPTPGSASVCMHRADAETRSCSLIEVADGDARFLHYPDSPCRSEPLPLLTLARRIPTAVPAGDFFSA